jgi:solute carrier family 13 (sodium-dependent dicarboxylate transporter), member 2/3/5
MSAVIQQPAAKLGKFNPKMFGLVLGPLTMAILWFAPLPLELIVKHVLAIVSLMIIYWITEPIEHGLTAFLGCFLFWVLNVTSFGAAFSGFATNTPWFIFGGLLMGGAAAKTGLATRIGYIVIKLIGVSYTKLLLSIIVVVLILNFFVPAGVAQVALLAPILIGIVAAFGLDKLSNVGRGLFVIMTYSCGLFNKMILAGGNSILTRGMVEKMTGQQIYWGQFFIAYLPATIITVFVSWYVILKLYPPEKKELPGGRRYLQDALDKMGPWSANEKKTLVWLLLAVGLWATDLLHGLNPAAVAIAVGLGLTFPKIGVLTTKDIKATNFLMIMFMAGAISMGEVLVSTKAVDVLSAALMSWMTPLLGSPFLGINVLYWSGFLVHFIVGSENSMITATLPMIINFAVNNGFNVIALSLAWSFSAGGKIFVYQSTPLVMGYSFGYFEAKDLIKVGLILTLVEGLIMALLVPLYWPLVGLSWK